jgi:prephenate dehydrogenase
MSYHAGKTAVAGLGLMGGSLCLALKKAGYSGKLAVYARREETVELARNSGMCNEASTDLEPVVRDADVVVICVPVRRTVELVERMVPYLKPGAVITDVGSTKGWLQRQLQDLPASQGVFFAGSHPIAGSEKTGAENAREDLYEGAVCVVTGCEQLDDEAAQHLENLWRLVGCRVVRMDADEHDRMLARTSHLPHLVSSALARVCGRENGRDQASALCGTGYAGMTRLAGGSADVWCDILETNRDALLDEIRRMEQELAVMRSLLDEYDRETVNEYLREAADARITAKRWGTES